MTRRAHALSHLQGQQMTSSWSPPPRRLTPEELQRMPAEDRLLYEMRQDEPTDEERTEELRQRLDEDDWRRHGDVSPEAVLENRPPPGWGE